MKKTGKNTPFFARFLTTQDLSDASGGCGGGASAPQATTLKYPSDNEDGGAPVTTLKYPSDAEDGAGGGGVPVTTLKFPSDSEDSAG